MPDRPPGTAAVADLVDLVRVHYCVTAHWTSCRSWCWGEQASPRLARSRQIPGALARHAQTAGCGSVFTLVVPNEYLRRFADQARKEYEVLIVRRAVGVCDVVRLGEHVRVRRSSPEGPDPAQSFLCDEIMDEVERTCRRREPNGVGRRRAIRRNLQKRSKERAPERPDPPRRASVVEV